MVKVSRKGPRCVSIILIILIILIITNEHIIHRADIPVRYRPRQLQSRRDGHAQAAMPRTSPTHKGQGAGKSIQLTSPRRRG